MDSCRVTAVVNILRLLITLSCLAPATSMTSESAGSGRDDESIFDILVGTIDAEILQVMDLTQRGYGSARGFEPADGDHLERLFRNRPDLFAGAPREIVASALDLSDSADLSALNEYFAPYSSTAATVAGSRGAGRDRAGQDDDAVATAVLRKLTRLANAVQDRPMRSRPPKDWRMRRCPQCFGDVE